MSILLKGRKTAQRAWLTVAACLFLAVQPAMAEAPQSTLERIQQTGVLKVGYGSTAPFSFQDTDGTVIGYSVDLCKLLAQDIRTRLGMTDIRIDYVPRTPANRIQLLNDGEIDIECNASTNTAERRKAVSFAPPHFIAQTRFVSLRRDQLRTLEDLRGKTVSVVLGTVNVGQILQISREMKLGLAAVTVEDVQAAFELVKNGSVSAFAMDDVLLANLVADTGRPQDYQISEDSLGEAAPYGFMTRRDDEAFATVVADALTRIYRSPQMIPIYEKWFTSPIGGGRYNLNIPMSPALKAAMGLI